VVGTTGFDPGQQQALLELTARVACVQASNMSAAVTVLTEVVEQVARRLGASFDIEIVEAHHRQKKDAPSGTAWMLARAAANGREARAEDWAVHGRQGITGPRRSQEMGVLALRGGDVVGDHTVYFFGQGERLELTHRAQSREAFASGALRAAHWVAGRPAGRYDMRHVLFGG
jgi:4-hydroxy-tetrahydrodipicolinate reductase